MLKNIALYGALALAGLNAKPVQACDACGCGVGSYQFGILPQQSKNFVGLRYQTKSDASTPYHDQQTNENFGSLEIWSRFYPAKRVQVLALLPYNFNRQETDGNVIENKGFGDALVLINYNLLNNTDSLYQNVKQNLFIGGGLKLPTGNFEKSQEGILLNPNIQLGTGSFDLVLNGIYTLRYDKIGLNNTLTYKINTVNRNQFRFGNKLVAGSALFSVLKVKEMAIMPNAGISTEFSRKDSHYGNELKESGGHVTFLTAGTELYFRNFSAGLMAQVPVSQKVSEGYVKTGNRLLTHFTFMF